MLCHLEEIVEVSFVAVEEFGLRVVAQERC